MDTILRDAIYQGIKIDLIFKHKQPMFGDLFLICGYAHPDFPASNNFQFNKLSELNFSQVDDYFGIKNAEDNVIIWLYPLVGEDDVYHHPGPFTGLRFSYNGLRNLPQNESLFMRTIQLFAQYLDVGIVYTSRNINLGYPPNLSIVENDIDQIIKFWKKKNIETGSESALKIAY